MKFVRQNKLWGDYWYLAEAPDGTMCEIRPSTLIATHLAPKQVSWHIFFGSTRVLIADGAPRAIQIASDWAIKFHGVPNSAPDLAYRIAELVLTGQVTPLPDGQSTAVAFDIIEHRAQKLRDSGLLDNQPAR